MKTIKLSPSNGNYYRSPASLWKAFGLRGKFRDVMTIAGGTLGLCAFMFLLYLMVLISSRVLQPITG